MRHSKQRGKLSRDASHRKALLANLCKEVIEHERIKTTEAKAKAVKPEVEKLITLAKRGDLHARRQALSALGQDKFTVYKLFEEVGPRYGQRPGGYTRILKLGPRRSDATEMVFLELVEAYHRPTPSGMVRASDDDRERVVSALRQHYAAGRLEADELEERVERATRAQWRSDLRALTFDLPSDIRARSARAWARVDAAMLRMHAGAYATVNGAMVGIWALTGGGEFWPAWTLVPWGMALGAHAYGSRSLRRALGSPRRRQLTR